MTAICSFFSNFVRLNCRWMKPILKYRGGKSKELSMLLPYVPAFAGRYIEPFMGGGATEKEWYDRVTNYANNWLSGA